MRYWSLAGLLVKMDLSHPNSWWNSGGLWQDPDLRTMSFRDFREALSGHPVIVKDDLKVGKMVRTRTAFMLEEAFGILDS